MKKPDFPYDGNFLKKKGLQEGVIIGDTLKKNEVYFIKNDFNISEEKVLKIINDQKY